MASTPASELLATRPRVFWGRVVHTFIRKGWNPPPPDERILDELLGDMRRIGGKPRGGFVREQTLDLAPAELRALQLAADGFRVAEAAAAVGVSHGSMKDAYKRLYRKLGAKSGPHAVAIGFRKGILR